MMVMFVSGCSTSTDFEKTLFTTRLLDENEQKIVNLVNENGPDILAYKHEFNNLNFKYNISFDHYYKGKKVKDSNGVVIENPSLTENKAFAGDIYTALGITGDCEYFFSIAANGTYATSTLEKNKCLFGDRDKSSSGFIWTPNEPVDVVKNKPIILSTMTIDEYNHVSEIDDTMNLNEVIKAYKEVFVISIEAY